MKNIYTKPEMVISCFENEDIITVSGGLVIDGNSNFKEVTKKDPTGDNSIPF